MRMRSTTLLAGLAAGLIATTLPAARDAAARGRAPAPRPKGDGARQAWLGTALGVLGKLDRRQKGVPRYGGVLVERVVKGSPAGRTGFQAGDVIMRLDGQYVYKPEDVIRRVAAAPVGSRMKIDIIRNGGWMTALVKLTPRPGSVPPAAPRARPEPPPRPASPPPPRTGRPGASPRPGAVAERLAALEREIRRLRQAILEMQRRCMR